MSAYNPPSYYFSNILFNSAFYISLNSALSQTQANALYLLKKTADTATALETFTGGILTNSLNTTTPSSNLQIGNSTNTGKIILSTINTGNTNADPAISIGTDSGTKTIKINNNTNSVHVSSLDINGTGLNNITNTTGQVDIGNLQIGGTLNIGTNNFRTADININTGTGGSANTNIGSGGTSGVVNIASGSNYTILNNIVHIGKVNTGVSPSYIEAFSYGTGVNTGNYLDFHSSGAFATDYDCRIKSLGGTSGDGQGTLIIQGKTVEVSGALTISQPLSYSYTTGISPSSTQLGHRTTLVNGLTATTSGTAGVVTVGQAFNLPIGVWIIQCVAQANTNSTYITTSITIGGTLVHDTTRWCIVTNAGATNPTMPINTTLTNATSGTVQYNYLVQASTISTSITGIYIYGTRIA